MLNIKFSILKTFLKHFDKFKRKTELIYKQLILIVSINRPKTVLHAIKILSGKKYF